MQVLSKLKLSSLLDLALFVPYSYEDTILSQELQVCETLTAMASVQSHKINAHNLQINLFLPKFKRYITATFFKYTPYHLATFGKGNELCIQGKVTLFGSQLQVSQPKKINNPNTITPKYKSPLKNSEVIEIVKTLLNEQNLKKEGLNNEEIKTILHLHFPKALSDIFINKSYKKELIENLKSIEAYNHFKKLQGKRVDFPPTASLRGDERAFIESLPFALTSSQQRVISQIKDDLQSIKKAAKRVIIGDVGSGKTIIILASAAMAYPRKSILMAPTSILALQLYEEACKFLPKEMRIALVTQSKKIGEYTKADFIIGTHALLYLENLPKCDLVMVDEQHRFGTNQRNSLAQLVAFKNKRAHFLQFSATPIPRTQAMMDSALVDVSLNDTTPFGKDIGTKVISREDFSALLEHIKDEVHSGNQVLIIYPLVEQSEQVPYQSLEEASGFWHSRFENVYVTHGKDRDKEEVLLDFRERGSILLATTVVEVGISLPKLTTVVIVGAERLGLATLHQLRGRVGRAGQKSHCFLYTKNKQSERLAKFAQTSDGFEIAKLDLEFRDSGDILQGTIQSGQKFRWLDMANDEETVLAAKKRVWV